MEHWIDHPSEPDELILAWQAPDSIADRTRWAVGCLWKSGNGAAFRYFDDSEIAKLNNGRTRSELRLHGYAGYPAFDYTKQPVSGFKEGVLEAFERRLPPAKRPDFSSFLEHFRFRGPPTLPTMTMLALTEARLPNDGFSLIDRLDPMAERVEVVFEIAGHRHNSEARYLLSVGDPLMLVANPENPVDPKAVRIEAAGHLIGHVNRLQAATVGKWLLDRDVSAWLIRLNGKPEAPRAFAFLQVRMKQDALAA